MPNNAMAEPCRSLGLMPISTDCERGTRAAPKAPCKIRKKTICTADCAKPQSIEATVKPATETRNRRFCPKRPARKPVGGDDIGGQHPRDLLLARRHTALDMRQRHIGDCGVERLHEGGEDHTDGDRWPINPGGFGRHYPPLLVARKSADRNEGKPRAWPVSTSISTLMPARSGGRLLSLVSTRTRIGIRCTTLTQLPLVFCAGRSWNSCAAAGLMLSTVPCHSRSG